MPTRSEKYSAAAAAYLKPPANPLEEVCKEISSFMKSEEWDPAIALIKASVRAGKKPIQVGYQKGGCVGGVGYFFGEEGFYFTYRENGVDSVHPFLKDITFANDVNVMNLAKAFVNRYKNMSFLDHVFANLDKIADACPK